MIRQPVALVVAVLLLYTSSAFCDEAATRPSSTPQVNYATLLQAMLDADVFIFTLERLGDNSNNPKVGHFYEYTLDKIVCQTFFDALSGAFAI